MTNEFSLTRALSVGSTGSRALELYGYRGVTNAAGLVVLGLWVLDLLASEASQYGWTDWLKVGRYVV